MDNKLIKKIVSIACGLGMITMIPFVSSSCGQQKEKCIISTYGAKNIIIEPGVSSSIYINFNTRVEPSTSSQDVVIQHSIFPETNKITFSDHTLRWNDQFDSDDLTTYVFKLWCYPANHIDEESYKSNEVEYIIHISNFDSNCLPLDCYKTVHNPHFPNLQGIVGLNEKALEHTECTTYYVPKNVAIIGEGDTHIQPFSENDNISQNMVKFKTEYFSECLSISSSFLNNSFIEEVDLSNSKSLQNIELSFHSCSNLSHITFPSSIISIRHCFYKCNALHKITFDGLSKNPSLNKEYAMVSFANLSGITGTIELTNASDGYTKSQLIDYLRTLGLPETWN